MSYLWDLLHKPVLLQTPLDRFWLHVIPFLAVVLVIVLAAVVSVCVDDWRKPRARKVK